MARLSSKSTSSAPTTIRIGGRFSNSAKTGEMSGSVRSGALPAYAARKYSSAMRRPAGVCAQRSYVPH